MKFERITIDLEICTGKPCIRGLRFGDYRLDKPNSKSRQFVSIEIIGVAVVVPDMTAISGGVSALKSAMDILKSIKDLSGSSTAKGQIAELYEKIITAREASLSAQEERTALLQRISELEKEVARLKAWGSEKEQYELKQVHPGAVAYVPKRDTQAAKQPHWLCGNCYEEGKKSFLQCQGQLPKSIKSKYVCPRCNAAFIVGYGVHP